MSAEVDERTRFEIYYPPFEGAVKAEVGSMMCSYNRISSAGDRLGNWSCEHPETLSVDLRERLNFTRWTMSDWVGRRPQPVHHDGPRSGDAGLAVALDSAAQPERLWVEQELPTAAEQNPAFPANGAHGKD